MAHYGQPGFGQGFGAPPHPGYNYTQQTPGYGNPQQAPYQPPYQPPYVPPPPPSQHYAQQDPYGYAQPPQQYQPPDYYGSYHEQPYVPPSKRYKYNSGLHYPQSGYPPATPQAPPYSAYRPPPYATPAPAFSPPVPAFTPPVPPFPPPPPTAWAGSPTPIPTPPALLDVRLHSSSRSESPPTSFGQEEDHHKKYSKNQHNQASHWQAAHGLDPQPGRRFTSLQWVAKRDAKDSTKSKSPSVNAATPAKVNASTSAVQSSLKPINGDTTKSPAKAPSANPKPQNSDTTKAAEVKAESVVATTETACDENNDSWDFNNYFPDEDEKIDERFSIGMVDWFPAKRVRHAISAMWSEAEMQELGAISLGEEVEKTSVSRYIKDNNLSEACRPVNKSKDWHIIRNDPAFADLTKEARFVTIDQLKERRGVRALAPERMIVDDRQTELTRAYAVIDRQRAESSNGNEAQRSCAPAQEVDAEEEEAYSPPPLSVEATPVISSVYPPKAQPTPVFRATATTKEIAAPSLRGAETHRPNASQASDRGTTSVTKLHQSNTTSAPLRTPASQLAQLQEMPSIMGHRTVSNNSSAAPSPKQLDPKQEEILAKLGVTGPPKIDQQQEDILAMLGVTGAPKPVGSRPSPVTIVPKSTQHVPGSQEDILARLGVTGEAKPVGSAPGPSYRAYKQVSGVTPTRSEQTTPTLPTQITRISGVTSVNHPQAQLVEQTVKAPTSLPSSAHGTADAMAHQSRERYSDFHGYFAAPTAVTSMLPPPPPPPPPPLEDLPGNTDMTNAEQPEPYLTAFDTFDASNGRPSSRNSQHTQAGSDFHEDEPQAELIMEESDREADPKSSEPEISIGKASLRARKRSRKQIETEEDADTIQAELEESSPRARKKRQTKTTATTASKRKKISAV